MIQKQKVKAVQIQTETLASVDDATLAYRNLLASIIYRAIEDVEIQRYRKAVLGFFCSEGFARLCQLLSIDAQAIRDKVVPYEMQPELTAQQAALAAANNAAFK